MMQQQLAALCDEFKAQLALLAERAAGRAAENAALRVENEAAAKKIGELEEKLAGLLGKPETERN